MLDLQLHLLRSEKDMDADRIRERLKSQDSLLSPFTHFLLGASWVVGKERAWWRSLQTRWWQDTQPKAAFLLLEFMALGFQFPTQLDIFGWKTKFILNRTVKT